MGQYACTCWHAGLFFTLNGEMYLPGEAILITDIGDMETGTTPALLCETKNVNSLCCTSQRFDLPSTNTAQWTFPNGDIVSRFGSNINVFYSRSQRIWLRRRNNVTTRTGSYECRVLDERTLAPVVASMH